MKRNEEIDYECSVGFGSLNLKNTQVPKELDMPQVFHKKSSVKQKTRQKPVRGSTSPQVEHPYQFILTSLAKRSSVEAMAKSLNVSTQSVHLFLKQAAHNGFLASLAQPDQSRRDVQNKNVNAPSSSTWTAEKDDRRCDLIDREINGSLTVEERTELSRLQQQMLDYRRQVAPLPIEAARKLHKTLVSELAGQDE